MEHKTALITGASRGIGRAIALEFAAGGYDIAITASKSWEELKATADEIRGHHVACRPFLADASCYGAMKEVFFELSKDWGAPGILINNAGIASLGLFTDLAPSDYEQIIAVNLLSVMHCCHLAVPAMLRRGTGTILNISSIWGICGASCEAAYSAAKSGVNGFTRALAKELAPMGIAVNALACGVIDTRMNRGVLTAQELTELLEEIPANRMASPQEAAKAVWQLANSPTYLTGQVIAFDGGFL
ncbi:MAG: SDR family oxidoreductase [Lachnospiraceae bacterium]|nr:SDR family oxidoreductase [Lachnospiraceae bacterium]